MVDALGAPLDGGEPLAADAFAPVEQPAPAIVDRALVTRPLATGLLVIDAMIPLGRGQRELIIGDRGTGKTAIAVDTIINQQIERRDLRLCRRSARRRRRSRR